MKVSPKERYECAVSIFNWIEDSNYSKRTVAVCCRDFSLTEEGLQQVVDAVNFLTLEESSGVSNYVTIVAEE